MDAIRKLFLRINIHYKGYWIPTIFSVIGLAVALAATLVILMQLKWDYSYDRYNNENENIYRLVAYGKNDTIITFSQPLLNYLSNHKIEGVDKIMGCKLSFDSKSWIGKDGYFASRYSNVDSIFIDTFNFDIIEGRLNGFDNSSQKVIISESLAIKEWGTTKIIGKQISSTGQTVAAVYRDFPSNSSLKNIIYTPILRSKYDDMWSVWNFATFVKLDSGANKDNIYRSLNRLLPALNDSLRGNGALIKRFDFVQLHDLHFTEIENLKGSNNANDSNMLGLSIIAIILVIMATFNFANFAIALVPRRLKNVTIERVVGIGKSRLFIKLIAESVVLAIVALFLGLTLISVINKSSLASIIPAEIDLSSNFDVIFIMLVLSIFLGILIGLIPAISLVKINVTRGLKMSVGLSKRDLKTQKIILGLQIICASVLVTLSVSMYLQEYYILHDNSVINREKIVTSYLKDTLPDIEPLMKSLKEITGVDDAAMSRYAISSQDYYEYYGRDKIMLSFFPVSRNYLQAMKIDIVKGRYFNNSDSIGAIIVNQTAVKKYPDTFAIGKHYIDEDSPIVGICKDVICRTYRKPVEPMAFILYPDDWFACVNIRISDRENVSTVIPIINQVLDCYDSGYIHKSKSFEDIFGSIYKNETIQSKQIIIFAIVVLIITMMGIGGIVMLNNEYKKKTIAIKRAFGASRLKIYVNQQLEYLALTAISFTVSLPLSWYIITSWLQIFFYKIDLNATIYLLSFAIISLVLVLVVSIFLFIYSHIKIHNILKYE